MVANTPLQRPSFLGGLALGGGKPVNPSPCLQGGPKEYLEDHPMTWKWLINMVIVSPLTGVVGPLTNGLNGL